MNISSFVVVCCVLCFFPEHNVVASDLNIEAAALRKKATSPTIINLHIRSTSFHHDEVGADDDSSAFSSKTQVPLRYAEPGEIGTAAVSNRDGINFGDLIIANGRMFLAVDTGTDVISKKASRQLAEKEGLIDSAFSDAPVVDFFTRNGEQVGDEWMNVKVIKCPVNFMKLKVAERKKLLKREMWEFALNQNSLVASR